MLCQVFRIEQRAIAKIALDFFRGAHSFISARCPGIALRSELGLIRCAANFVLQGGVKSVGGIADRFEGV